MLWPTEKWRWAGLDLALGSDEGMPVLRERSPGPRAAQRVRASLEVGVWYRGGLEEVPPELTVSEVVLGIRMNEENKVGRAFLAEGTAGTKVQRHEVACTDCEKRRQILKSRR